MTLLTIAAVVGTLLVVILIGQMIYTVRRVRQTMKPRWWQDGGPVTYDEPMPWECSDYTPPARVKVQADFIEKE